MGLTCASSYRVLVATVTTQQAGQSAGANPGPKRDPKTGRFGSSVFKKAVMAVTGIIMILFLIAHMIGNLHVFQGAASFNDYSEWLRQVGEPALPPRTLLTVIEIVLLVSVLAHGWAAVSLWRQAKRARPIAYQTKKRVQQSYASRTMRWGGVIVGLFIIYHLLDLTFGVANIDGPDATPYDRLIASMSNPVVVFFYVLSLLALGFHLRHGVWSATQTLGQSNKRRERAVNVFATAFAVVLIGGYLVIPFVVLTGIVA
ncbi:succinate dehydrogenase subunit C [Klenkia brasiliensis]|uniref:Succinate dehydrogenase subunit C n=1 Tax=Klenkia brasiliensis TaxID=333142 RepID=A0A1G7LE17_9ACTN|nr:succinate dehydrogenase subunit C [Klenkia brasiliensis]